MQHQYDDLDVAEYEVYILHILPQIYSFLAKKAIDSHYWCFIQGAVQYIYCTAP